MFGNGNGERQMHGTWIYRVDFASSSLQFTGLYKLTQGLATSMPSLPNSSYQARSYQTSGHTKQLTNLHLLDLANLTPTAKAL